MIISCCLAVVMRALSDDKQEREAVSGMLGGDILLFQEEQEGFVAQIGEVLYGGMILTYSQGLTLLRKGSLTYHYGLDLRGKWPVSGSVDVSFGPFCWKKYGPSTGFSRTFFTH
ncbi:MAG: hypothetical protein WA974_14900 [Thermodesulfobacteriota bacterium]